MSWCKLLNCLTAENGSAVQNKTKMAEDLAALMSMITTLQRTIELLTARLEKYMMIYSISLVTIKYFYNEVNIMKRSNNVVSEWYIKY